MGNTSKSGAVSYLSILGALIIWSSSFVAIKIAYETYPPVTLGAARFVAATLILGALTLLPKFLKGQHLDTKFVTYFTATELSAECEPSSLLDVDGDVLPGTPVTFRVLPQALWVIVPQ